MSYYADERREVLPHVPSSLGQVLELGCGEGRFGRLLRQSGRADTIEGVDLFVPTDAAEANLDVFHRSDVVEWLESASDESFDTVVALDVLEHLADPWHATRQIARVLRKGGRLVASIPNVRYVKVLTPLVLQGRFDYADHGVLDRTHLRFFTRGSISAMVHGAGLTDVQIERLHRLDQSRTAHLAARLLRDLGCAQFVVTASKAE